MAQTKAIVDKLLTNVSNGIFPEGYVADLVLPQIGVVQKSGLIGNYGNNHLRIENDVITGESVARRVNPIKRGSNSYLVQTHALEGVVTQDDYDNVEQPFEAESDETSGLTYLIKTNKEKALADALFSTSVITNNATPSTKYDQASANPLLDFANAHNSIIDKLGVKANTAVMSMQVANYLRQNANILDTLGFNFAKAGLLTDQELARALNVDTLYIGQGVYNSSVEGQADSLSQLWSDGILFYVRPQAAGKYQLSLGYQMVMRNRGQQQVYKYSLNNPPNSNGIIVQSDYSFEIVNTDCGFLLNDCLT